MGCLYLLFLLPRGVFCFEFSNHIAKTRLAELLDMTPDEAELVLSEMVVGGLYASMLYLLSQNPSNPALFTLPP